MPDTPSTVQGHGPTIHTVVMDERTTDLFNMIEEDVRRRLADFQLGFVAAQGCLNLPHSLPAG